MPRFPTQQTPQPRNDTPPRSLSLDGYHYAINKLHNIANKYAIRNDQYAGRSAAHVFIYKAWETVSHVALLRGYNVSVAIAEFEKVHRRLQEDFAADDRPTFSASALSAPSSMLDSPEVAAAKILTSLKQQANEVEETTFPDPQHLPVPDGEDARLLNPVFEDMQQRWVRAGEKTDRTVEVEVPNGRGGFNTVQRTVYMVGGRPFRDYEPGSKAKESTSTTTTRKLPPRKIKTGRAAGRVAGRVAGIPTPSTGVFSAKSTIDSGVFFVGESYEDDEDEDIHRPRKRLRPTQVIDNAQIAVPKTRDGFLRRQGTTKSLRKASNSSEDSNASTVSAQDVDNMASILDPQAMDRVIKAVRNSGRMQPDSDYEPGPSSSRTDQATNTTTKGKRRAPPAPLYLPPPPTPTSRIRNTFNSSPLTPSRTPNMQTTPQHSSVHGSGSGTPRSRNKYVPTTPNPHRWTAAELYFLNDLARKGLHPKELHPRMMEAFPDRQRSVHAVKDRRDKMMRAKELVGTVPDYNAKYGDVD